MEEAVTQLLTPEILQKAAERFGTDAASLSSLEAFENFVYAFDTPAGGRILRLTHASHRTRDEVTAELEWLTYLADAGAPVARALPSRSGVWVEFLPVTHNAFCVTCFDRAPGHRLEPHDTQGWNDALFTAWGRTVGTMHRLTKDYCPGQSRRLHWSDEPFFQEAPQVLKDEPFVLFRLLALTAEIDALPRDRESYGLSHTDVHPGNFFVDNGRLTVFDFDDSAYHYFAHDVAMVLYYAMGRVASGETPEDLAARLLPAFLAGYETENTLAPFWLGKLETFMLVRDIVLYLKLQQKWEPGVRKLKPAQLGFVKSLKDRIDAQTPRVRLEGIV